MTIHSEHPFLPPEPERNPIRRLRGRLAAPVTVLTAEHAGERAGLTVSSVLVVDGEPGELLAIVDPSSDLHDAVLAAGRAVLNLLGRDDRRLADAFGYVAPAPGGPFRLADWQPSDWGPVLAGAPAWAGCRLAAEPARPVGWAVELRMTIETVTLGPDEAPLLHHRGRYRTLDSGR
ncbi:MAG TPA: flavin reductase family protein [Jatrophihabitans sp.]|nr:flavin reductase family protein [Jatrophihabitans sp.]